MNKNHKGLINVSILSHRQYTAMLNKHIDRKLVSNWSKTITSPDSKS